MNKTRLEAFSDAVIAIVLTIMVLELRPPHESTWAALLPMWPKVLSYLLSFIYLGIYWNNHHHLFQAVKHVRGSVLWANLHLLFWLSLVPFTTSWLGESGATPVPTALYGIVLLGAAISYGILVHALLQHHDKDSLLAKAIGRDLKGNVSILLYLTAVGLAFAVPIAACVIYVLVAIVWLVPDLRIERVLIQHHEDQGKQ